MIPIPRGTFTHWIVFDIDPQTVEIKENQVPDRLGKEPMIMVIRITADPNRPPANIAISSSFALDTLLNLPSGASRSDVEQAMAGHVLDQGEIMGRFSANQI